MKQGKPLTLSVLAIIALTAFLVQGQVQFDATPDSGSYTWSWDDDGDALGWTLGGTATGLEIAGGIVSFTSTGNDPMWISPAGLTIEPQAINTLILRFRNGSNQSNAGLYWTCNNAPGFPNYKAFLSTTTTKSPQRQLHLPVDDNYPGRQFGVCFVRCCGGKAPFPPPPRGRN